MPISIPSRRTLIQSVRGYFLTEVPEWDTSTQRRSFVRGLIVAFGSALHDLHVTLKRYAEHDPFPQSARGEFLTQGWWADITKLTPNAATPAQGTVVVAGDAGTVVEAGTELRANGLVYEVDHDATIVEQAVAASSLTSAGGIATFNTAAPHLLATGQEVVISGAAQGAYNGTVPITVISDNAFTYPITGAPASPATGSPIKATGTYANLQVTCRTEGIAGNLDGGATLEVEPLVGAEDIARVTYPGVAGGADKETEESYRERLLFALGTDFGAFTANEIEIVVRQTPGVTRVWVREAMVDPPAGWPEEGQVFVAFMRDGDSNPYPTALEVAAVKTRILETCMTANTAPEDVVVTSPTPHPIDFEFGGISPDTPSMRAAVTARLQQFFRESVDYATNVLEDDYRAAIHDTYDTQTRARLKSFSLVSPSGNVSISSTSLPALGDVSF